MIIIEVRWHCHKAKCLCRPVMCTGGMCSDSVIPRRW